MSPRRERLSSGSRWETAWSQNASGSERNFLIAEDEFAGAAGGPVCPSGGFHVYEITGELEKAPEFLILENVELSQGDAEERGVNVILQVATYYRAGANGN